MLTIISFPDLFGRNNACTFCKVQSKRQFGCLPKWRSKKQKIKRVRDGHYKSQGPSSWPLLSRGGRQAPTPLGWIKALCLGGFDIHLAPQSSHQKEMTALQTSPPIQPSAFHQSWEQQWQWVSKSPGKKNTNSMPKAHGLDGGSQL